MNPAGLTPTDGTPLLVDPRTPTFPVVSGFRTQARAVAIPADRPELLARIAELEQQLAALHVDLATERDRHALTETLLVSEMTETLRLTQLHAEASASAAMANGQIAWMTYYMALVGAELIELRRRAGLPTAPEHGDEDTEVVDVPLPGGAR